MEAAVDNTSYAVGNNITLYKLHNPAWETSENADAVVCEKINAAEAENAYILQKLQDLRSIESLMFSPTSQTGKQMLAHFRTWRSTTLNSLKLCFL
eukprot:g51867.t1